VAAVCLVPPLPVPFLLVTLWQKKEVRGTKWFAESDTYPGRFGASRGSEAKRRREEAALAPCLPFPEAFGSAGGRPARAPNAHP